jgi:hypothetical protein
MMIRLLYRVYSEGTDQMPEVRLGIYMGFVRFQVLLKVGCDLCSKLEIVGGDSKSKYLPGAILP